VPYSQILRLISQIRAEDVHPQDRLCVFDVSASDGCLWGDFWIERNAALLFQTL
jgi:hypothetical protein